MDTIKVENHVGSFFLIPGVISHSIFMTYILTSYQIWTPPSILSKNCFLSRKLFLPHSSDTCVQQEVGPPSMLLHALFFFSTSCFLHCEFTSLWFPSTCFFGLFFWLTLSISLLLPFPVSAPSLFCRLRLC